METVLVGIDVSAIVDDGEASGSDEERRRN
jgi:hypothetical protein